MMLCVQIYTDTLCKPVLFEPFKQILVSHAIFKVSKLSLKLHKVL